MKVLAEYRGNRVEWHTTPTLWREFNDYCERYGIVSMDERWEIYDFWLQVEEGMEKDSDYPIESDGETVYCHRNDKGYMLGHDEEFYFDIHGAPYMGLTWKVTKIKGDDVELLNMFNGYVLRIAYDEYKSIGPCGEGISRIYHDHLVRDGVPNPNGHIWEGR